jgi:hypothetical protein
MFLHPLLAYAMLMVQVMAYNYETMALFVLVALSGKDNGVVEKLVWI